ncbi:MAG: HlyD family efflux transporter periplasmic adaptor subunit [Candidatus Dormibacteraeota bacterium]|nr:HlyD family efflux transporter periplasmic adaptor subunit [Candidatus Dormibacteraeota bacterium]
MRSRLLTNLLKRRVLVILVLVFAILGGSIVYAKAGKITTTYRTAVVTYGTITQTIGMAGNLAPVSEADLNFTATGTIQTVTAQVGETVVQGQALAALDPTVLAAQLSQAQATLAAAQSKLAQDRAGPTAQSLTSAQNQVAAGQVAVNNATTSLVDTQAINAQSLASAQTTVAAAHSTVTADQAVVDQDNVTLTADLLTQAADCPSSPRCAQDTATVNADKAKLAADQQTLARDQAALNSATSSLAATTAKAQQSNNRAAAQLASAKQQLAAAKSSLAAGATPAQTIQIDEAQIQIDQVNVNTTQHQLDGARLTTPIAGIVAQVNIKPGQSVGGGASTTYAIVVFAPGSYQVTGTVSDSQVNLVAIGQTAQVTPAGSTQAVLGKISAIAPAATIASGVATFGVTAQLTDISNSIKPGISATVSIVVNQVVHVLTVPTSAVHTTATGNTVQVLVNGAPQSVSVQVGASDPTRTEILSGLKLGQVVVIAVITNNVPSSGSGAGTVLGGGGGRGGGGVRQGG